MEDEKIIKKTVFEKNEAYREHPYANPSGGMDLVIKENFFKIARDFVNKYGKKLFSSSFNLASIIPPPKLLDKESYLMINARAMTIIQKYFKAAASETNPIERLS